MDNAFDDFYKHYSDMIETRDGYYMIRAYFGDFIKFMLHFGWHVVDRGNSNYPAEIFVTLGNRNYPNGCIGILKVDDGIHVGNCSQFD